MGGTRKLIRKLLIILCKLRVFERDAKIMRLGYIRYELLINHVKLDQVIIFK